MSRECFRHDGEPKARYESKKEAKQAIQRIAEYRAKAGGGRPNAFYECSVCGNYHLWRRGLQKEKEVIV